MPWTYHSSHVEDVDEVVEHDIATTKSTLVPGTRLEIDRGKLTATAARSVH